MGSSLDLLKPTPLSFLRVIHPSKAFPDPTGGEGELSGFLEGGDARPNVRSSITSCALFALHTAAPLPLASREDGRGPLKEH